MFREALRGSTTGLADVEVITRTSKKVNPRGIDDGNGVLKFRKVPGPSERVKPHTVTETAKFGGQTVRRATQIREAKPFLPSGLRSRDGYRTAKMGGGEFSKRRVRSRLIKRINYNN